MSKEILDQLQFEKNKREILKQSQASKQVQEAPKIQIVDTRKYAWEYELENYRKSKLKDKFHTFGAICGIIALILTLLFNFDAIGRFLMKF